MSDMDNLEKKAKEVFEDLYEKMDKRIRDLSDQFKDYIIPEAEEKLRKNVFRNIFISFGIGFVLGIILTFFGLKSGNKKK